MVTPKEGEPSSTVSVANGFFSWLHLRVESIDNLSPGLQMSSSAKFRIYPGRHTLIISASFNEDTFNATTDITADFKSNQNYVVKATVHGDKLLVWIEDKQGQKAGPVASVSYHAIPKVTEKTVYVHETTEKHS